jgi:hypothetical protein
MPTARIEIEHANNRWTAEIEAGGVMARCRTVRADDFDAIMAAVCAAYREMSPHEPAPAPPARVTPRVMSRLGAA